MGFLDKLLGRKQAEPASETGSPPASTPPAEEQDQSHGEGEQAQDHSHDESDHQH